MSFATVTAVRSQEIDTFPVNAHRWIQTLVDIFTFSKNKPTMYWWKLKMEQLGKE